MTVLLNKPISKTPLEMIEEYKEKHSELADVKIGYAGRLDPMAEGLLLLLVGDENKERKVYEDMDKEYEFTILFGLATDSYDVMGMFVESEVRDKKDDLRMRLSEVLKKFTGTFYQDFPPYSSAVVGGKPMYWWSRKDRLGEIVAPKKLVSVKELEVLGMREVGCADLAQTAIKRVQNVVGDFRQEDIIKQWRIVAELQTQESYTLADCRIVCSSGTYVRGLCDSIGRALNIPALAYSIKRTRIGKFTLS